MKRLDIKNFNDIQDVFKMMVGKILENSLDSERDYELSYSKYDYHNKKYDNSHNSYSKNALKTIFIRTGMNVLIQK